MADDSATPPGTAAPGPFPRTSLPGRVVFGDGALAQLAGELDQRGLGRAMLIVGSGDRHLAERGAAVLGDRVTRHWDEVRQHVPAELAVRARAAAAAAGADVLVPLGGGSPTRPGQAGA